jgi:hypothetical protein
VDLPTQPLVAPRPGGRCLGRRGIALPSAMFALVAASILAAGVFAFADLSAKAQLNQERTTRALQVADAGIAHAVSVLRSAPLRSVAYSRLLRGATFLAPSTDDSLLIGWAGLAANDQIPLAGKAFGPHTYWVSVRNDPIEAGTPFTDVNGRVLVRCWSQTSDGARAEVAAIVGAVPMPGIAADGGLAFAGGPVVGGACGGVHANGDLSAAGGGPTVNGSATATGTVTGTYGPAPKVPGVDEVIIPDLNPMAYCGDADYRLGIQGGVPSVQTVATGVWAPVATVGWTYTAGSTTWNMAGGAGLPGTYCVTGNASISGGGAAGAPMSLSVLATGSIALAGNAYLAPDHPEGILLMAAGDVSAGGNPGSAYSGLVYAGAQCAAAGNATLSGQLLCANGPQPAGATSYNLPNTNTVQGSFTLNFDCGANIFNKRRVLYWYPRVGT